jgi:hypothetical protein
MHPILIIVLVVVFVPIIILTIVFSIKKSRGQLPSQIPDQNLGVVNPKLVCPHCQAAGKVRAKEVQHNAGVSGGKVVAMILTAGISLLFVGLSRIENKTVAHCDNCGSNWMY